MILVVKKCPNFLSSGRGFPFRILFNFFVQVVAAGRNEAPTISDSSPGFRRLLDPYVSTYRAYHKPFTIDEQYGVGAKDHITFYTEANVPRVSDNLSKRRCSLVFTGAYFATSYF